MSKGLVLNQAIETQ